MKNWSSRIDHFQTSYFQIFEIINKLFSYATVNNCRKKLFIVFVPALMILLSGVLHEAHAASIRVNWVNPVYRHLWERRKEFPRAGRSVQAIPTCESFDQAKVVIRASLKKRKTVFTFKMTYDFVFDDVEDILNNVFESVLQSDDYLAYNLVGYSGAWSGCDGDITVTYENRWHTLRALSRSSTLMPRLSNSFSETAASSMITWAMWKRKGLFMTG